MKMYLISDNVDTQMGMRLAGVDSVIVHTHDEVINALSTAIGDDEVAVIMITETLLKMCHNEVYDIKLHNKKPLIIEIPDRHGNGRTKDSITKYVQDAIGVKL